MANRKLDDIIDDFERLPGEFRAGADEIIEALRRKPTKTQVVIIFALQPIIVGLALWLLMPLIHG